MIKKGTQSAILTAYMFHEVDEGLEDTEKGETGAADGAPAAAPCCPLRPRCCSCCCRIEAAAAAPRLRPS